MYLDDAPSPPPSPRTATAGWYAGTPQWEDRCRRDTAELRAALAALRAARADTPAVTRSNDG